jgi:phthalate 4,5-cis-dihydrodiol dehydrogenase
LIFERENNLKKYRLGVTGIGRGFALMMPTLKLHPQIDVVAGVDPNLQSRESFQIAFDRPSFSSLTEMLETVSLDAVCVASPHQFHLNDVLQCISYGKVVLCEKPMTIDLVSAKKMAEASVASKIPVVIGPSHSYDEPILHVAKMMVREKFGAVRMLQMLNYTDFLFRPRRPEELDVTQGGGVLYRQASHQMDIARLLCGGIVTQINARTGNFDVNRFYHWRLSGPIGFSNGAFASLTYSGYAHYDSDELCSNISELGFKKPTEFTFHSRKQLDTMKRQGLDEAESKAKANQQKIRAKIVLPDAQ